MNQTVIARSSKKSSALLAGLLIVSFVSHAQAATLLENPSPPADKSAQLSSFKTDQLPEIQYDHGNPSPEAQYLLELTNRARINPALEGNRLAQIKDSAILQAYSAFNLQPEDIGGQFSEYQPQPPLAFNPSLLQSALRHGLDLQENDFQAHIGSDGSQPDQRMVQAGYAYRLVGENAYSYAYSVDYGHAGFLVDWGVETLGHRNNILNITGQARFREVGITILADKDPSTQVGPLLIVQNFGRSFEDPYMYITGVVYRDSNGNGFYDPGEGMGDVNILPDNGQYYAVTSSSGGYAIPMGPNSGTYQITAYATDLPKIVETVTVGIDNIKLDFIIPSSTQSDQASDEDQRLSPYTYVYLPPANQQDQQKNVEDISEVTSMVCPSMTVLLLSAMLLLAVLPYRPQ